jgi:hypothetical protein
VATSGQPAPAAAETVPASAQERLEVVRRRRPGNTVAAVVLVVITALFL